MKFTALLTGLVLALPIVVFGAFVPAKTAVGLQARASDGDAREYAGLETRALGDVQVLENRQVVESAAIIVELVAGVTKIILDKVNQDNLGRGDFTQRVVSENRNQWPNYNWIICHTAHTQRFDGVQGVNWDHFHREYDIQIGGTIGYEIYWFESGSFDRHGDGGFENWAYSGDVVSTSNGGATVVFA